MKYASTILVLIAFASAGVIHPQLAEILETLPENEPLQVIVHMNTQADWSMISEDAPKADKILYLQSLSESDQADILAHLENFGDRITDLTTWWIFNGLTFSATKDIIEVVAAREDVDYVIDDFVITLDVVKGEDVIPLSPEWGVSKVKAPECWNDGYDGTGIIVGNIDTGVDKDHPCFGGRWVSGGWYDAVNGLPNPYDDNGHGTHTMGTICGGDGNGPYGDDVGVAPGCNFIAAKGLDLNGSGAVSWLHNCFSWFAGTNANVCSNSWGSSSATSTEFWNDCVNLRNLGIYPVFSIGNSGPNPGTAGTPGNFPIVIGVGMTNSDDDIDAGSSRGPAPNINPWNNTANWSRPDWNFTKPDISAPGVAIRSAAPGGGWAGMSGTSMACPHVAGGVAICLQRSFTIEYDTLYNILLDYADQPSQGSPYPNNDYGWGRLNIYNALYAITVGNVPEVILTQSTIVNDNNGNGKLDPGENAGIVCLVKNVGLQPATNLQGTLRTGSSYITINDSTYTYSTLNPGDSVDNSSDPFDVFVSSSTPVGTIVDFELFLACAESTWTRIFSKKIGTVPGDIIWGPVHTSPHNEALFIYGIGYDQVGDRIYVCEYRQNYFYIFSSDSLLTSYGTLTGPDNSLTGLSYSPPDDKFWCTSSNQKQIWKIDKSGAVLRQFPNPANDYPIGLALNYDDILWSVDRRGSIGATQYIYIGDTLENFNQYTNPVQGNYNSRNLAYDTLGHSFIMTHTWFNAAGTQVDSVGVVEYQGEPPTLTGNRFLLPASWNIRGIEFDPRDGNYWIGIPQLDYQYVQAIAKVKGFHDPVIGVKEGESKLISKSLSLTVHPNPVTSHLVLDFQTPHAARVSLRVYDAVGRLINNLLDGVVDPGSHNLKWNLKDVNNKHIAGGIYFLVLETVDSRITQQIIVTR